jgi:hypothetical protein
VNPAPGLWRDPHQAWTDLAELQHWTDARLDALAHERLCPATGTSVAEAWASEQRCLTRLPETLPEPFDLVAVRVVGIDALVSFEGRQYSVPFRFAGERVEVRGCAGKVQIVKDCAVIATHPRATAARLVIDQEPTTTDRARSRCSLHRRSADWVRSSKNSPSHRSRGIRSIFMPPWRRWPDERAQAEARH